MLNTALLEEKDHYWHNLEFGILPLHIETGRFRDKKINERECLLCNSGEAENEQHFRCLHHIF